MPEAWPVASQVGQSQGFGEGPAAERLLLAPVGVLGDRRSGLPPPTKPGVLLRPRQLQQLRQTA